METDATKNDPTKRVLCIWLPNWPTQRITVDQPELSLADRPIVLHVRDPRRGQRVAHCNRFAQDQGIQPDMSLAEVTAIMRRSAGKGQRSLHLSEHDPRLDRESLQRLAEQCEAFSPSLGLEDAPRPDSLLLDVTHSAVRLGGESQLVERIHQSFRSRGYRTSIAIAETLATAWAVAHFATPETIMAEQIATEKIATDSRTAPAVIVPNGQMLSALRPLPIESLRLENQVVDLLHQLGVRLVQQLLELPRAALKSRFGAQLLRRIDQALGTVAETFTVCPVSEPLQVTFSFEHPTSSRQVIVQCMHQLAEQLSQRLQKKNRGAICVEAQFVLTDQSRMRIHVGLFRPSVDATHWKELLQMQLDRQTIADTVQRVELTVSVSASLEHRQACLLEDAPREIPGQLAHLVDRMSNRLGRDTVLGARLIAEPQAERALRYVPLTGQQAKIPLSSVAARKRHHHAAGLRPLHVTAPPQRLHTTKLPTTEPPASFGYQGRTYHVASYWGPERIETGWWQGQLIRRDYYQVEDEHGSRFWLFRDLASHTWFLHGVF